MGTSHFSQPIKDWSARKHAVLQAYLPSFCKALSRQGTIWYVDGYAGAGIYRNPDTPNDIGQPGSPVLAAQITDDLPYDIRCLNVEEDQFNYESLERETASFTHVTNIHADFNDVVDQVLSTLGQQPAFFFLDPFGTKDLPMDGLVDHIAMRKEPTDILLRYATETVRRLAGAYERDLTRRAAHARNLDRWFRGSDWRAIVQQFAAGPDRDRELLNYYMRQLTSISGGRLRFAAAYPIRSIEDQLKYHLVFATGDRLGLKLMNDVLYRADLKYRAERDVHQRQKEDAKLQGQMTMFDELSLESAGQQYQAPDVEARILEVAREGRREWEFEQLLYELILHRHLFARIAEKDVRAACRALHAQNKIERLSTGNAWSKGTRFRIKPDG